MRKQWRELWFDLGLFALAAAAIAFIVLRVVKVFFLAR